jgi:hypothetical protein
MLLLAQLHDTVKNMLLLAQLHDTVKNMLLLVQLHDTVKNMLLLAQLYDTVRKITLVIFTVEHCHSTDLPYCFTHNLCVFFFLVFFSARLILLQPFDLCQNSSKKSFRQ